VPAGEIGASVRRFHRLQGLIGGRGEGIGGRQHLAGWGIGG
jgi:hypothetical protein